MNTLIQTRSTRSEERRVGKESRDGGRRGQTRWPRDWSSDVCSSDLEEIRRDGGEAVGISCDVTDKTSVEAARSGISERFGTCDILVNGAGGNNPSASTDDEYLDTDKIDEIGRASCREREQRWGQERADEMAT